MGISIKKFFKKNLRDIATVVGFAVGGPAGAAIGQGIGSTAEGRSLRQSLTSAAKVYGGANLAAGAGITPETITPGSGSFLQLNPGIMPGTDINSIPGFLQQTGATIATGGSMSGVTQGLKDLSLMQKLGLGGLGLAGLGAFDPMEQPNNTMPAAMGGQYLTRGLTPATLSDVYGTAGIPSASTSLASAMPGAVDPITQTYLEMLAKQDQDYGMLAFPEFSQQPVMAAKDGGIARLADGGAMPEVDLRNSGGDLSDPNGSGDEDTIPALLADGEFVMTKQAVKGIGNGNHNQGIAMLYAMMDNNEQKAQRMGLGRA